MTTTSTAPRSTVTTTADSTPVGKRGIEILDRLRAISEVEKAARDLADEKKALAAEFATLTGGAKFATFQGVKVATRIDSHSTKVDTKMLAEAFPEAHAATVSQVPYSYYRQA